MFKAALKIINTTIANIKLLGHQLLARFSCFKKATNILWLLLLSVVFRGIAWTIYALLIL